MLHIVGDQLNQSPRSEQAAADRLSLCDHCSCQNLRITKNIWDLCYNKLRKLLSNSIAACEEAEILCLLVYHLQENT